MREHTVFLLLRTGMAAAAPMAEYLFILHRVTEDQNRTLQWRPLMSYLNLQSFTSLLIASAISKNPLENQLSQVFAVTKSYINFLTINKIKAFPSVCLEFF